MNMKRGDEKNELRRQKLLQLHGHYSWEEIARRTGTDHQYLSQIANKVVQKGGKTPRSLSDNYVEKIENGLSLPNGWMDNVNYEDDIQAIYNTLSDYEYKLLSKTRMLSASQQEALLIVIQSMKRAIDLPSGKATNFTAPPPHKILKKKG
ncbi:MAG: hypothetical protein KZQ94_10280 [Candidatus Thiodiazotropha sp. (ex Troendleina suluensis)]|nr:hypothetical protein [Candidatus Thiodiazotropha sp. (ex Troendleina suluensis)]